MPCPRCGHDPDAKVTASWSFFVDKQPVSLNARLVNGGPRWKMAAYRAERDEWLTWMQVSRVNERIPAATQRRRVKLVRIYAGRQRMFDVDGFVGGAKPIVDAMVSAGLIVGDDAASVEIEYAQRKGAPNEQSGLWVTVEELCESTPTESGQIDLPEHDVQDSQVSEYIDEKECARRTTLSVHTLQVMRTRGSGPPWVRVGERRVAYKWSEVERWIDDRTRTESRTDQGRR